jgi:hypothetical protein
VLSSNYRRPQDAHLHCTKRTICYELLWFAHANQNSKIGCKCRKGRRQEQLFTLTLFSTVGKLQLVIHLKERRRVLCSIQYR